MLRSLFHRNLMLEKSEKRMYNKEKRNTANLPLPLGEVAERSEDGEGKYDHTKRQQ